MITLGSESLTFTSWKLFQQAFPDQLDRQHGFYISDYGDRVLEPMQLPSIVLQLSKIDQNVLTMLCIRNFYLSVDHLLALTKIPNLATLVLEQHRSAQAHLTAKDLHYWSRAARETSSFQNLKMLVLSCLNVDTHDVLRPVSQFPALTLLGLRQNEVIRKKFQEENEGWCKLTARV